MAAGHLPLPIHQLEQLIEKEDVHTVIVAFTDHYGRLMGKYFAGRYFLDVVAQHGTHACNYLLTTDMEMEPLPGFTFANWEKGYGDFHLQLDMDTLRLAGWTDGTAIVLSDVADEAHHKLHPQAPRSLLKAQLARFSHLEYEVIAASELEFFLFKDNLEDAAAKTFSNLTPGGRHLEDYHILQSLPTQRFNARARDILEKTGIPVESSKGEWGKGQNEINIRYAPALDMADRHVLLKQCLKHLAEEMGMSVTFMAKYDEAQAGSSCHIHMSLWQRGSNAFDGTESLDVVKSSAVARWFLGGLLRYTPDVLPFYASTVNAYKRFADASWAPTRLAWSYDNRTAAFRVVGKGASLRIENRIPGADCNPYLAYSAMLACGLAGIQQQIEPGEAFNGDVYAASQLPSIERHFPNAIAQFAQSAFCEAAFGAEAVEHYTQFFRAEWDAFQKTVTDWERRRYFERI